MPTEYLLYLNFILISRLIYLRLDTGVSWPIYYLMASAQAAVCLLFFSTNTMLWLAIGLFYGLATLGWKVESQQRWIAQIRLLLLLLLAAFPGLMHSLGYQFEFSDRLSQSHEYFSTNILFHGFFSQLQNNLLLMLGGLLLINEANILTRMVFTLAQREPQQPTDDQGHTEPNKDELNAGRIIGILERWLIYLVILGSGGYEAIAFILAAKGLIRFKNLDDQNFAEYVLIGTLTSVLIASVTGAWVKLAL